MNKPNYELSEIDKLFFNLFGFYPNKEGQSYEMIVGAVLKILYTTNKIIKDERKRGLYDKNLYQIDVSLYSGDTEAIMVEAKDHTKFTSKVSRPEIDKMAGSLIEIDFASGYFFSATDYTRDAKKKSIGSKLNPAAKDISLYHLRPSTSEDRKGRVEIFKINLNTYQLDANNTVFSPTLPPNIYDDLKGKGVPLDNLISVLQPNYHDNFIECKGVLYDNNRNKLGEFDFYKSLDKSIYEEAKANGLVAKGTWKVDRGSITINGHISNIELVHYKLTFVEHTETIEIKSQGTPVLLVKSEDGTINKLITDYQLKGITFSDDGEIHFDGRSS